LQRFGVVMTAASRDIDEGRDLEFPVYRAAREMRRAVALCQESYNQEINSLGHATGPSSIRRRQAAWGGLLTRKKTRRSSRCGSDLSERTEMADGIAKALRDEMWKRSATSRCEEVGT